MLPFSLQVPESSTPALALWGTLWVAVQDILEQGEIVVASEDDLTVNFGQS